MLKAVHGLDEAKKVDFPKVGIAMLKFPPNFHGRPETQSVDTN